MNASSSTIKVFAIFTINDHGQKVYLCNAPKLQFGKSSKRKAWTFKKEKNALAYLAECQFNGINAEMELIDQEVETHKEEKPEAALIPEVAEVEVKNEEEKPVNGNRDHRGRFIKKSA